jgi:hypothetical protein
MLVCNVGRSQKAAVPSPHHIQSPWSVIMSTTLSLWRSVRIDDYPDGVVVDGNAIVGVLYPDFEERLITSGPNKGGFRAADVVLKDGFVHPAGGTSLFDKADVFGAKYWCCFPIPAGTVIPAPLIITGPKFNKKYQANHYQIETSIPVRLDSLKMVLDNLARNAVVRACELARA